MSGSTWDSAHDNRRRELELVMNDACSGSSVAIDVIEPDDLHYLLAIEIERLRECGYEPELKTKYTAGYELGWNQAIEAVTDNYGDYIANDCICSHFRKRVEDLKR